MNRLESIDLQTLEGVNGGDGDKREPQKPPEPITPKRAPGTAAARCIRGAIKGGRIGRAGGVWGTLAGAAIGCVANVMR